MTGTGNLSVEAQTRYAYVEELLLAHVPAPADVVELGAAPGDQIARLADMGYRATSVDLGESSDDWGDGKQGRMSELYRSHGVADVTWDLEQVPYPLPDESFDAVIMTEVFEHLRDYPVRSLQEVRRLLRPGGRLFFTTPNVAYVVNRMRAVLGRNTATPLPDWIAGVPHARHAREYTVAEIRELMAYADLRILSLEGRHFHLDSGRTGLGARIVKRGLGQLAERRPTLGPQIVVVAERERGEPN